MAPYRSIDTRQRFWRML
ncbi:hypothetical protein PENSOL_c098G00207 [Penicillium solitum]|uniref:Uncharacterized protein n=1 Tax=Penicillium solitum TaxID=60172 RepID=A0A1V6Q8M7_9EURO|nr:hypothetical protein PENSOL_c098G00207 [Penicillium solitum]